MEKKEISEKELFQVLNKYDIGVVKSIKKIERYHTYLQPAFIIETDTEKFFLKQYWEFDYSKKKGLEFNVFLQKKGYPCNKVILNKERKPYVEINKKVISIFEYISYEEKHNLNLKEYKELGKYLGKLHVIGKKYKKLNETLGPEYFYNEFCENNDLIEKAPETVKQDLRKIRKEYPLLMKEMSGLPKGICHTEFSPEHTRFNNNKLVAVIDWDLINTSYLLYDLGTTLSTALIENDFKPIEAILKGYEEERKLEPEERERIKPAIKLGTYKYITWALDENQLKKTNYKNIEKAINRLRKLNEKKIRLE